MYAAVWKSEQIGAIETLQDLLSFGWRRCVYFQYMAYAGHHVAQLLRLTHIQVIGRM